MKKTKKKEFRKSETNSRKGKIKKKNENRIQKEKTS